MSLFQQLQWNVITNPRELWSYRRILKEKDSDKEEKEKIKELYSQKKQEMSEEEYEKWRRQDWYQRNKERIIDRQKEWYRKQKEEEEAILEDIYETVYDVIPDPINYDKYYTEKFKKDDTVKWGYRFAWWSSRLARTNWKALPKQRKPFRISNRNWVNHMMKRANNMQNKAYLYMKPYIEETRNCYLEFQKKQQPYDFPMYRAWKHLREICDASEINNWYLYLITDALRRDKYIPEEVYLWRNSFIFWDVLVTQTGHLFRLTLENNFKRLTKDTVEEIHEKRIKWWKEKAKEAPPIYIVNDAYLIKIPINEWETYFYIVPT